MQHGTKGGDAAETNADGENAHVLHRRVGKQPFDVRLTHHKNCGEQQGQEPHAQEGLPRHGSVAGGVHQLHRPQNRQKGNTGQATGEQSTDHAGCFTIGIGLPGMQGRQAHFGAETNQ